MSNLVSQYYIPRSGSSGHVRRLPGDRMRRVSRTATVRYRDRHFWALDDALAVWLAYLVEEFDAMPADSELAAELEDWRIATFVTDYGANIPVVSESTQARLLEGFVDARSKAMLHGDVSTQTLEAWKLVDDRPVSGGFSRSGGSVELPRIMEVADAFIALMKGSLPPDPVGGWWFLGTGHGFQVIPMRS